MSGRGAFERRTGSADQGVDADRPHEVGPVHVRRADVAEDAFETRAELFDYLYTDRASEVLEAYRGWEEQRTLGAYSNYLEATGAGRLGAMRPQ